MERQSLIELTADIVASHVTNNHISVGDLSSLISRVHEALAGLGAPEVKEAAQKTPVVSARASVKPDYLVCMECGRKQKTLKRHLATSHSMSPEQYRADFGLPRDYPMTAPNYSERRRDMAKAIGLGRGPGPRKTTANLVPATKKAPARHNRRKRTNKAPAEPTAPQVR